MTLLTLLGMTLFFFPVEVLNDIFSNNPMPVQDTGQILRKNVQ